MLKTKHLTEEHKRNISKALKGRMPKFIPNNIGKHLSVATEFKNGHPQSNTGRTHFKKGCKLTEEAKSNISKRLMGNKYSLGYKHTLETRIKDSEARKGVKHWNWQGGINPINDTIRKSFEFRIWREAVFTRDSYTCQKCGRLGGEERSHHIKNFAQYPELRFAIDNGITLCKKCHQEFHRIYGKKNNTKEQLEEFLENSFLK